MSLIVDANIVVKWFVDESWSEEARQLLLEQHLRVPAHALGEIGHVLVKQRRAGKIAEAQFDEIKSTVPSLLESIAVEELFAPALDIAWQTGITVYDALYVAAALKEKLPFVTADERLVNRLAGSAWATTPVPLRAWSAPR